jgi:hypothetical protein
MSCRIIRSGGYENFIDSGLNNRRKMQSNVQRTILTLAGALLSVSFWLPLAAIADDSCENVSMIENGSYPGLTTLSHEALAEYYESCALSLNPKTLQAYNTRISAAYEYLSSAARYEKGNQIVSFIAYVKAYDLAVSAMIQFQQFGIGDENFAKEQSRKAAIGIRKTAPYAIPRL